MTAIRQDAWSEQDDLMLAEVTLRHIREGSTQLTAFEEVGNRIGRTAAACGFRWNSFVRKNYETAIQNAKLQRQKKQQQKRSFMVSSSFAKVANSTSPVESTLEPMREWSEESVSIDAMIRFLRQWKQTYHDLNRQLRQLEREVSEKDEQLLKLKQENDYLNRQFNNVETDYRTVNDDYKTLIQIMDRARRMAVLSQDEEENKPRFKMDENGNLERIE